MNWWIKNDLFAQAESKVVYHSGAVKTYCEDCFDKETSFTPLTQSKVLGLCSCSIEINTEQ